MDQWQDAVARLQDELGSPDPGVRNKAAMRIRDLAQSAARGLFEAIMEPANAGNVGTLVYAASFFNCSAYFLPLFALTLRGSFEARCEAIAILRHQRMRPRRSDVRRAREMLDRCTDWGSLSPDDVERLKWSLRRILSRFHSQRSSPERPNDG